MQHPSFTPAIRLALHSEINGLVVELSVSVPPAYFERTSLGSIDDPTVAFGDEYALHFLAGRLAVVLPPALHQAQRAVANSLFHAWGDLREQRYSESPTPRPAEPVKVDA